MRGIRAAAGSAVSASLVFLALAGTGFAAADAPVFSHSWHSLAAADEVGALLFSEQARRARTAARLEDDRRAALLPDRSAQLRSWLSRYGSVVAYEHR